MSSSTQDISLSVHSTARTTGEVQCRLSQDDRVQGVVLVHVQIGATSLFLDVTDARVLAQQILQAIAGVVDR